MRRTHGERGGRVYNGGLGGGAANGVQVHSPWFEGQGVRGRSLFEAERFSTLECLKEAAFLTLSAVTAKPKLARAPNPNVVGPFQHFGEEFSPTSPPCPRP